MCSVSVAFMLVLDLLAAYMNMPDWLRAVLIAVSFLQLIPCFHISMKIEQRAGYYMCKNCGHRWVPEYRQVLFAPHFGRSRKMTCPHCGKRNYHKKVLTKEKRICYASIKSLFFSQSWRFTLDNSYQNIVYYIED